MAGRGAHHGGLNWEIDDPGEHGRATERGTGGGGWFIRSPDLTKSMGAYLGTLRTRFVGCFQGHDSPAEVPEVVREHGGENDHTGDHRARALPYADTRVG